jgi:hypothetical protein
MLRISIIILTLSSSVFAAHAKDSLADAVAQCAQTSNSLQRLVCFDRIAGQLSDYSDSVLPQAQIQQRDASQGQANTRDYAPQQRVLSSINDPSAVPTEPFAVMDSAPVSTATPTRQAPPKTASQLRRVEDDLGITEDFGRVEVRDDTLFAAVADISFDRNEYFTVTLNNGQVWKQTEISRLKIAVGDRVEIEEGRFGGFILTTEQSNRTARVKRID